MLKISAFLFVICLFSVAGCSHADNMTAAEADKQPDTKTEPAHGSAENGSAEDGSAEKIVEQDWTTFLGPEGTGVSRETGLLLDWPKKGLPVLWEIKVGTGYSAPSVRGHRLVLHHRVDDQELIECFDTKTGESLWKQAYNTGFEDPYGYNNGPRCSPLLTQNRCVTFGAEGMLTCVDLQTGKRIWQHNTRQEYQLPDWFFGVGCSPIRDGNHVIVMVGGQPNAGVVAFDLQSGKKIWSHVGRETWDGAPMDAEGDQKYRWTGEEQVVSYASPFIATIHDKKHLLCLMRQGLVSLDPDTGKENFKYWFRARVHESVNAARPIVIDDKIFLSSSYRVGSALLQVQSDGKHFKVLWRKPDNMQTHWSTAIHVDGFIYGFSGRHENGATFRCIDLKTGNVQWETTGFAGQLSDLTLDRTTGEIKNKQTGEVVPYPYYGRGSKIRIGDYFIVWGERGTLALVKINPESFQEITRLGFPQLKYPTWTAPVLSHGRLYLRGEERLLCLNLRKK